MGTTDRRWSARVHRSTWRRGLALLVVIALAAMGAAVGEPAQADPVLTPETDPFYAPPVPVPAVPAGTVLRSRPVTVAALGIPVPVDAWQLLYRSNDAKGAPAVDVATLILPRQAPSTWPRPLVSYQTAEDSLAQSCAPSFNLRLGLEKEEPLIALALLKGWAVVVPDYEGLQSQWTAGAQEGHAVLDGVRAATGFAPAGLAGASTPVGLWGYSGGGQASAWAAELQPGYAPELNIRGVAAGGVPVNVGHVARIVNGGAFSGIYFGASVGLSRAYPEMDIDSILNDRGKAMVRSIGTQCITTFAALYAFQRIESYTVGGLDPLTVPRIQAVIAADALGQHTPRASMYVYQSLNDELVGHTDVDALVKQWCRAGAKVTYQRDLFSEHITLAVTGAPGAVSYLADRFANRPDWRACW